MASPKRGVDAGSMMSEAIPETDLANRTDVELLLRRFYGRVFDDDTLAKPRPDDDAAHDPTRIEVATSIDASVLLNDRSPA